MIELMDKESGNSDVTNLDHGVETVINHIKSQFETAALGYENRMSIR